MVHSSYFYPSVLHESYSYARTDAKAAALHSISSFSNVDLPRIARDCWDDLLKGTGKYLDLITPTTERHGYKRLGLTQEDILYIKNWILRKFALLPIQKFGSPHLPAWLQEIYESRHIESLKSCLDDEYDFLGPKNIRLSVTDFFVQDKLKHHKKNPEYVFLKKGFVVKDEWHKNRKEEITDTLEAVKTTAMYIDFINADSLDDDAGSLDEIEYIIIEANSLAANNQKLQAILTIRPDMKVIVAFDDQATTIRNTFTVPRMSHLIVAGINITTIGDSFLSRSISLISIILPAGLTHVGNDFLYNCTSLTSIIFPAGLTYVGDRFLFDCTSLTSIVLPAGLTQVGSWFLAYCSSLKSIVLPASLTQAGDNFLSTCTGLTSIVLPVGLRQVGDNFLFGCRELINIVLPAGLTQVGDDFLAYCTRLINIVLPAGLTKVGNKFLANYTRLTSIVLPAGLTQVGNFFLANCTGLTSIVLPAGLTHVGDYFLFNCSGLTSLIIPRGLTQVGDNFLFACLGLTSIVLPAGLTQVGDYFLTGCIALTSLIIPRSLTQVGRGFLIHTGLKELYIHQDTYEKIKASIPERIEISFLEEDQTTSGAAATAVNLEENQRASGAAATAAKT